MSELAEAFATAARLVARGDPALREIVALNAGMALPPVVVGLLVYLLLSRAGPLGALEWLFAPTAMVIAQTLIVLPIVAALTRQTIENLAEEYGE